MSRLSHSPAIVWFRQDLRLADNPALTVAAQQECPLIFLYILDDETAGEWCLGGAQRWWLHHSLISLKNSLQKYYQASLILRRGTAEKVLVSLVQETEANQIYWNRCYEPFAIERDKQLKEKLQKQGIKVASFNSALLFEPWEVKTKTGGFFKVFTPFWNACQRVAKSQDIFQAPENLKSNIGKVLQSESLESWQLLPTHPDWAAGLRETWQPGERNAWNQANNFIRKNVGFYKKNRDFPALEATSFLSPYLHFGEISPRQIIYLLNTYQQEGAFKSLIDQSGVECFLKELGWREFAHHLMYYFPSLPSSPFQSNFSKFPWHDASEIPFFQAWCQGKTGYPIIDAGMRQLWYSGWMHNRVRMIVASFLTKNLLIPWQKGEAWFWDTLVDADLSNNAAGWQWVAGCGADAAPYFRIFNPITQGKKFDPAGDYVRRWLPELGKLSNSYIHHPWEAPLDFLNKANIVLGDTYPFPIVSLPQTRQKALAAYNTIHPK